MAHRKSQLKLKKQGVAVNADIRTAKLDPEDVTEQPEVIQRDRETGTLITSQVYDKATDEPLEEGYGYRYLNEEGDEVPSENIEYYQIKDGEESKFTLNEPTLGSGRTVSPITWIPVETADQYLVERTYEMWGEESEDVAQLFELATLIRDYDEAPVIEVVLQRSKYKSWGIITPQFFEDAFAMIIRLTKQKIVPAHEMPQLRPEDIPEDEDTPTLEQESPFQ